MNFKKSHEFKESRDFENRVNLKIRMILKKSTLCRLSYNSHPDC